MRAADVLAHVERLGAKLIVRPADGKLAIRACKGTVTSELIAEVTAHKEELRGILTALAATGTAPESEASPAASDSSSCSTGASEPPVTTHEDTWLEEVEHWKTIFNATEIQRSSRVACPPVGSASREFGSEHTDFMFVQQGGCRVPERAIPWAQWKAGMLNKLFQEQGVARKPGRIRAMTVRHGERRMGDGRAKQR